MTWPSSHANDGVALSWPVLALGAPADLGQCSSEAMRLGAWTALTKTGQDEGISRRRNSDGRGDWRSAQEGAHQPDPV